MMSKYDENDKKISKKVYRDDLTRFYKIIYNIVLDTIFTFILDCGIIKYIKETCTTARFGRKV